MNRVTLVIASTALVLATASLIRREQEIKALNETFDILHRLQDEIQFAKIVEHLDGED